jgi:hypothetical protein
MTNGWDYARNLPRQRNYYGDYINVLAMIAASGNEWRPSPPSAPIITVAPGLSTASDWARGHIQAAFDKGFIPSDIQGRYTSTITRGEFCRMAVKWAEYATGKSIDTILTEQGLSRSPNPFTDTNDPAILAAFALGITAGTGPATFNPNGQFTREQAATMIMNTCRAVGANVNNPPAFGFADIGRASSWAVNGINFAGTNGIMSGTGEGNFSPARSYTRQESIIAFNNIKHNELPGR